MNAAHNTRTGGVLEAMVLPALANGGYRYQTQVRIGERPNGRRHFLDVLANDDDNNEYLISLKWQQVSGTAEQKVPYEIICLAEAIQKENGTKAYLVLGGAGWSLRDYYLGGGLNRHLVHADLVTLMDLENFVALANQGKL
ncbi:MAG: hypothetical protein OXL41_00600 [Nitrospinae bacterium]|nr:hypothetical protein [Nitrospinota bacterium]